MNCITSCHAIDFVYISLVYILISVEGPMLTYNIYVISPLGLLSNCQSFHKYRRINVVGKNSPLFYLLPLHLFFYE